MNTISFHSDYKSILKAALFSAPFLLTDLVYYSSFLIYYYLLTYHCIKKFEMIYKGATVN